MWAYWPNTRSFLAKAFWGVPIVLTFRDCISCPIRIEGRSMEPLLSSGDGRSRDIALAEKFRVLLFKYERGGIYVLRSPEHPKKLLVKRLIALEGDWVAVPGQVDIYQIPKGFCWIEGDNSPYSEDSRSKYGPVPVSLIEGKLVQIIWPPNRVQRLQSQLPSDRVLIQNSNAFKRSREETDV